MRAVLLDRRAQPVKNHSPNPALQITDVNIGPLGASTPVTTAFSSSFLPAPARAVTYTSTADGAMGRRWNHNNPLSVGDVVRFAFWITTSVSMSISPYIEYTGPGATYAGGGFAAGTITVPANVRTRVTGMAVAPKPASVDLVALRTTGFISSAATSGTSIKLEAHMVTINQPLPDVHCDGNTPGWKWLGTVGLSPAIGWPYTLDSIAGKPDYDLSDPSKSVTVELPSVPALQGRSFYIVPEVVVQVADGNPFLKYGNAVGQDDNAGTFLPRQDNLNTTPNINLRIASGGATYGAGNLISAPIIGMHAGSVVIADGFASYRYLIDSVATPVSTATSAQFQSGGMPLSLLTYNSSNGPTSPRRRLTRALFYQREHSSTTQRAVMRWLANRYGVPVSGAA
jgi:hypothetical protein